MPIRGIILIFMIALIACWWFREDIIAFIKGEKKKEKEEEKDSEENKEE